MPIVRYRPNRPELVAVQDGVTRDSPAILTLSRIWADRGAGQGAKWQEDAFKWYQESLSSWLGWKFPSKSTRDSYRSTLLHFFDFVTRLHARIGATSPLTHPILAPHEVRESDVEAYVKFLKDGGTFVQPEMERDKTDQCLMTAVARAREAAGRPVSVSEVLLFYRRIDGAPVTDDESIGKRLRDLARKNVIDSTPRWRDAFVKDEVTGKLRKPHPFEVIHPDAFKYLPVVSSGRIPSPATIAQRLSAVSSFFQHLVAEKPGLLGMKSPVVGNPVSDQLKKASSRAKQQRPTRTNARKTTINDFHLLMRLIERSGHPELISARDRLVMWLLQGMGLRVSELCGIRNHDITIEQNDKGQNLQILSVTGKGEKVRRLAMPARVVSAWEFYRYALLNSKKSDAWKTRATLSTAPLVSAVARKGFTLRARPSIDGENLPMEPGSIREIFRRYIEIALDDPSQGIQEAVTAWIGPESAVYARLNPTERRAQIHASLSARLHPHGLRHLFTQQGLASGLPIHIMSALLGHENVATTMVYAPEQRTEHIRLDDIADSAMAYIAPVTAAMVPAEPAPAPQAPPAPQVPPKPAQSAQPPQAPPKAPQAPQAPSKPAQQPRQPAARPAQGAESPPRVRVDTVRQIETETPPLDEDLAKAEKRQEGLLKLAKSSGPDTHEGKAALGIANDIEKKIDRLRAKMPLGEMGIIAHRTDRTDVSGQKKTVSLLGAMFFIPSPLYAYETPPVLTRDEDAENPVWTYQRRASDALKEKHFSIGSRSLLPYFVIHQEDPVDTVTGKKAQKNIVPIPCLSDSLDIDRTAWKTSVVAEYDGLTKKGKFRQAAALTKWLSFMLGQQANFLAASAIASNRGWIAFDEKTPANGDNEGWEEWKKRVRTSTLRAHDFDAGILPWLREHDSWTGSFDPAVDPTEYVVDLEAEAALGVVESIGEKTRTGKDKKTHISRIGRWAFTPPQWLVMTEDPLGDDRGYGIPIERRDDFDKWATSITRASSSGKKVSTNENVITQVFREKFDNALVRDAADMKRPKTPGAAVRTMLQYLQSAAEDLKEKRDPSDHAATIASHNQGAKALFAKLGREVWPSGEWPGTFMGHRFIDGKLLVKKMHEFDVRIVEHEWREAIFAFANVNDPSANNRLVDVMVQVEGERWGLFDGLDYNVALHTLAYRVDPLTGKANDAKRREFFKQNGVDPLVAARRILRWMWERREYMIAHPSKTSSMDTAKSLVKMASVYMSWVMPTDVGDIKTWAEDTLRDANVPFVSIGYESITKAFSISALLQARLDEAHDEEDYAVQLGTMSASRRDVMDIFLEAHGRSARTAADDDRPSPKPDGAILATDEWSYVSGPDEPEALKKNRVSVTFEQRVELAMEGVEGFAMKNWPIVNSATINPVAWMLGILS